MKKKNSYHVWSNVGWMAKNAWRLRKSVLFIVFGTAALEVFLQLVQLYITPVILQQVERKAPLEQLLWTIGGFTALLFLLRGCREYLEWTTQFARIDVRLEIISMIGKKMEKTSYPNVLDEKFIRLREKAYMSVNSNRSSGEEIWETLTLLLQNVGGFVAVLTILAPLDLWLMALIVLTCLGGFFVSRYANNWRYQHREEEERLYAKKVYIREKAESIELAKDIRIFGLQNWMNEINTAIHNTYRDFRFRCERVLLLGDLADVTLTIARNGIAYGYLIHLALEEHLAVSQFLLYFTAISTFTTWVNGILQQGIKLHKESLDLTAIREFLNYPEVFQFQGGESIPEQSPYELKLAQVSYRYPGADRDTICRMDLTIHPGEKLAVVGLNGAGKTTLVKLLCGLLDPTEGKVLLNGVDIRRFNRQEYYKLFSAVFQNYSLLDVTVAENVTQKAGEIHKDRLWESLRKAGLDEMIDKLPQGINSHVGRDVYLDGILFSGGQTQRLMLARALYKDGPVLILDEPTAALDPLAENDIYMKYNEMTKGKTSVFISHRLASTRFCDRILYLEGGCIAEEGTHEELIKQNGAYARLFEVQSRYYQEGREF